jgi:hypothetical protein
MCGRVPSPKGWVRASPESKKDCLTFQILICSKITYRNFLKSNKEVIPIEFKEY